MGLTPAARRYRPEHLLYRRRDIDSTPARLQHRIDDALIHRPRPQWLLGEDAILVAMTQLPADEWTRNMVDDRALCEVADAPCVAQGRSSVADAGEKSSRQIRRRRAVLQAEKSECPDSWMGVRLHIANIT